MSDDKENLILRLGTGISPGVQESWVMVLRDYDGPPVVCNRLIEAIVAQVQRKCDGEKHRPEPIKKFTHVEILGKEWA
jgi:hypothetical protein